MKKPAQDGHLYQTTSIPGLLLSTFKSDFKSLLANSIKLRQHIEAAVFCGAPAQKLIPNRVNMKPIPLQGVKTDKMKTQMINPNIKQENLRLIT